MAATSGVTDDVNKTPPPLLKHQNLPTSSAAVTSSNSIQQLSSPNPITTPATATVSSRSLEPSRSDVIFVPSYSRWFLWNKIHECEVRILPEFFEGRSASKNPRVYRYYRNSIIQRFRENPNRKITFTEVRKTIIGDVGSVRRVFDFLEAWGLINYLGSPSSKPLKWEDKENTTTKSSNNNAAAVASTSVNDSAAKAADLIAPKKRFCSECKSVCSIACFACDKYDLTLCARCFVRGNYKVGVSSTDFRRVEINDEVKIDWTDKETLHLLEAVMHYGDDWKRVAEIVGGGRSARECVAQFVKLPFGEQFVGPQYPAEDDEKIQQPSSQSSSESGLCSSDTVSPTKKMRLTPLSDASNPIMAQAAFLSALVGVDVAETAARAAVWALYEGNNGTSSKESLGSLAGGARQQETFDSSNCNTTTNTREEEACVEARLQLEKEEGDLERAISHIAGVQMKEIQDKITHFEEFDLQMEKEAQQLEQLKNQLFVDQLTLLLHKTTSKSLESPEAVKAAG